MKHLAIFLVMLLTFAACGGYKESVKLQQEQSFLKFTGNAVGVAVSVDGGERFVVEQGDFVYKTKPGKHEVKVFRGDRIVVDRELYVASQETTEVQVP